MQGFSGTGTKDGDVAPRTVPTMGEEMTGPAASLSGLAQAADGDAVRAAFSVLRARRPEFSGYLDHFEDLLAAVADETARLSSWDPVLPGADALRLSRGVPLLQGADPAAMDGFEAALTASLETFAPLLAAIFPPLGPAAKALRADVAEGRMAASELAAHVLDADSARLAALAGRTGLDAGSLAFMAHFVISPVFRRLRAKAAPVLAEGGLSGVWPGVTCPVCGGAPSLSFLSRAEQGELSEYLRGGGGQRLLSCGQCGHVWRTRRIICPGCGTDDQDSLFWRAAEGAPHERIYGCSGCSTYLPCIDLRECSEDVEPLTAPLGLAHLDIAAREYGLSPVGSYPWNAF
ncbi:formate dehydrogenase accessory protein [Desulfovibrio sp. X2]|uniref:formate dehydrogenase accessory protein FdhE n=1 Tax=Desulfovibrio sp. X2 TaxID=941449 RepID=UPI0003588205|nr:formate dehydrogenase accessory protein FdhE [Desulfovibrio sp. X2]EPR44392.1 formate dehydrogenase accessory protein [Desulfovibrio sp. X2]